MAENQYCYITVCVTADMKINSASMSTMNKLSQDILFNRSYPKVVRLWSHQGGLASSYTNSSDVAIIFSCDVLVRYEISRRVLLVKVGPIF
jgi:hypothetical protein